MKLRIISVGNKMPSWVETACAEYTKRMPREANVEIVDIKPEKRAAGNSTDNIQLIEAKRILEAVGKDFCIALDERGQEVTTLQLADKFKDWQISGRDVSLIIGGADGLHSSVKQKADWLWGLSKLTLPHAMVRVLLAEQLYRAHSVITNHPYHRE
ncbi:23S rRNA (pseudouridine(1915)-N(3))-methyltransferase RlmH [Methylotenera sp.]|uniref:23S rRNA (pseudouridine(1915)-N(3))-methyltransferase RlmH n=1 Tax=Methylotenera sp. TaxID=2051956 RepID=UPI00271906CA|nr:23S rRNA (pseudouridine(1915)-N(3))-methyltransferase RlmH [Methylotenera sp.]MDO9206204.1 23S rRNA (pseudouridine(1915)-N(3))-methyltransferase RlmH [Methylotenera sp.]MDO9394273.1 23S rRNA (pseudouridine(1915)-N(3))-methyltransferase RlmH [Methylotenera sp.]MDP1523750.1 23S rRNA (pseudouridine(1915)-N(3))-methyltransferase RlmH [Methylotenera sp.]MDP2070870.1 23S rRNA (pseudouridine(1915)-N(3))-methyltransferase RlmH [Methylotenera sp.]MDP2230225.1 23S rRNA (pseudouridine(1915)-N(3))-meth